MHGERLATSQMKQLCWISTLSYTFLRCVTDYFGIKFRFLMITSFQKWNWKFDANLIETSYCSWRTSAYYALCDLVFQPVNCWVPVSMYVLRKTSLMVSPVFHKSSSHFSTIFQSNVLRSDVQLITGGQRQVLFYYRMMDVPVQLRTTEARILPLNFVPQNNMIWVQSIQQKDKRTVG